MSNLLNASCVDLGRNDFPYLGCASCVSDQDANEEGDGKNNGLVFIDVSFAIRLLLGFIFAETRVLLLSRL